MYEIIPKIQSTGICFLCSNITCLSCMCEQNKCCMCRQTYNDDSVFLLDNRALFETEYRDK